MKWKKNVKQVEVWKMQNRPLACQNFENFWITWSQWESVWGNVQSNHHTYNSNREVYQRNKWPISPRSTKFPNWEGKKLGHGAIEGWRDWKQSTLRTAEESQIWRDEALVHLNIDIIPGMCVLLGKLVALLRQVPNEASGAKYRGKQNSGKGLATTANIAVKSSNLILPTTHPPPFL